MAVTAALLLVAISFLPYWASLELVSNDSVSYGGPTRFSIWDAYPIAVMIGMAICVGIFTLGVARLLSGKPSIPPPVLYVGGGVVVTLLFLYGLVEGPNRLFDHPFHEAGPVGDGPVSFEFQRGPLLYVSLIAAATIVIGGVLAYRSERQPGVVEAS